MPNVSIFLDVDDLEDIGALEEYVRQTAAMLFFLSRGYFRSRNCLREIVASETQLKPVVLVHEGDQSHGGETLEALFAQSPIELRQFIFNGKGVAPSDPTVKASTSDGVASREVIPWHRIYELQLVSIKMIAAHVINVSSSDKCASSVGMLANAQFSPHQSAGTDARVAVNDLTIPNEITTKRITFLKPVVLWCSSFNPDAPKVAKQIVEGLLTLTKASSAMKIGREASQTRKEFVTVSDQPPAFLQRDNANTQNERQSYTNQSDSAQDDAQMIMVLYLNRNTWTEGDRLAEEVRAVREAQMPILLLHERDPKASACEFAEFFETTPQDLILGGLYKPLAIAWHPGVFRDVCVMQVALTIIELLREKPLATSAADVASLPNGIRKLIPRIRSFASSTKKSSPRAASVTTAKIDIVMS